MATIDVSDILSDPDFADTFDVERRVENLVDGVNSPDVDLVEGITGVVTANDDIALLRTPEGARLFGSLTIHTTFTLTDGAGSTNPDIVLFRGRRYLVTNVGDWSHFGAGFVVAICTLEQLSPP